MVALPVKEEKLPAGIHRVDLSAMSYIKSGEGKPEQTWKDFYITIVGFPNRHNNDDASPLTVSIGRIKGEKGNVHL